MHFEYISRSHISIRLDTQIHSQQAYVYIYIYILTSLQPIPMSYEIANWMAALWATVLFYVMHLYFWDFFYKRWRAHSSSNLLVVLWYDSIFPPTPIGKGLAPFTSYHSYYLFIIYPYLMPSPQLSRYWLGVKTWLPSSIPFNLYSIDEKRPLKQTLSCPSTIHY